MPDDQKPSGTPSRKFGATLLALLFIALAYCGGYLWFRHSHFRTMDVSNQFNPPRPGSTQDFLIFNPDSTSISALRLIFTPAISLDLKLNDIVILDIPR